MSLRKLLINLETDYPEAVAYLDGYLTGMHDIGWIRSEQKKGIGNTYEWLVDIEEKRIAYSNMSLEKIENDLNQTLEFGLSHYMHDKYQEPKPYKIHVEEAVADLEPVPL